MGGFAKMQIELEVYSEEHPHTASSYLGIGNVHSALGDNAKALEYYYKSLQIRLKVSMGSSILQEPPHAG